MINEEEQYRKQLTLSHGKMLDDIKSSKEKFFINKEEE